MESNFWFYRRNWGSGIGSVAQWPWQRPLGVASSPVDVPFFLGMTSTRGRPPGPRLGCHPTLAGPSWVRPQRQLALNPGPKLSLSVSSVSIWHSRDWGVVDVKAVKDGKIRRNVTFSDAECLVSPSCLLFPRLVQLFLQFPERPQCPSGEYFLKIKII